MKIENWDKLLNKYEYASREKIYERIENKGFMSLPEDQDIINSVVLWKLNRQVSINDEDIENLNSIAKTINKQEKLKENEKEFIEFMNTLLERKGLKAAMASTILHFYQPNVFPIIDKRAYRQVFGENLRNNCNANDYLQYCYKCYEISEKNGIEIKEIDKVLYQLDKERGFKLDDKV